MKARSKLTKVIYSVAIEVSKSPSDVFNHLVDLQKWWLEGFEGDELRLITEFILRTSDGHFSKNRVVEFLSNKKLVWLTTESLRKADNYDWSGTKFIFELMPRGTTTQLTFTYNGVVLENEHVILVKVCDLVVKEKFYNFIVHGKTKLNS